MEAGIIALKQFERFGFGESLEGAGDTDHGVFPRDVPLSRYSSFLELRVM